MIRTRGSVGASICAVCSFLLVALFFAAGDAVAQRVMYQGAKASPRTPESLNVLLDGYLGKHDLPALGVAVVKSGRIIAMGAVGTRKAGAKVAVTASDRFHLGSDTKAITALLAGMYVEEGKLRWDSTPKEIFPELEKTIASGWDSITLEGLLSHTSGMPGDDERFDRLLEESFEQPDLDLKELRCWIVSKLVTQPLAAAPGKRFAYSNMGYIMAGAMIEHVAGKSWEELVMERVFVPLRLGSAGFGPQSTMGMVDAPLPHKIVGGKAKPMLAGPNADNPLIVGPAGTVHMSLRDFARWAIWNLGKGRRGPGLVRPETFAKLTTPVIGIPPKKDAPPGTPSGGRYCLGWGETVFPWAKAPFLSHGGSNGMNLAHIMLEPKSDFGMVLMTNIGGEKAAGAFHALEEELYRRYGK